MKIDLETGPGDANKLAVTWSGSFPVVAQPQDNNCGRSV